MPELAGKLNEVWILAGSSPMTNATGAKISGVDNSTWKRLCDMLETNAFGNTNKTRMGGLLDNNVTISGNLYDTDTGQGALVEGAAIYIGVYHQGHTVNGRQMPAIIESIDEAADASGKQTFSASILGNGAPVTLPLR